MKNNETIEFENIIDEIKYEFQDLVSFISYVIGQKSNENGFIDLVRGYSKNPANDNWPINETKSEKLIERFFVNV
ncbi:MAG: hypothetical protein HOJ34_00980 [Kordiimonadaceae bacterium]|nr:hypothetical protein [Kordiimonadaceae bacterium]MBT6036303.1 hypothetical protein [Kordiimonadaceae bacterium]MBT6328330.1 hypothetical protein [Kordiimonadaceae bacterium]MBT7582360.1 hypothetical protein [Kordiimonadaceae bacterium]